MKILFAVDLAEPVAITRQVEALARRLDAELYVLHVYVRTPAIPPAIDPMTGFGDFAYVEYDPEVQRNIEQAEAHEFHSFLNDRFTRPVRPALMKGEPAAVILEESASREADLIVLCKRHHSRLERLLLGSVTAEVVEHSSIPVLLMPVPAEG